MKHCSFFCAGWWPFLVFPLILLALTLFFCQRTIESRVADNARGALSEIGADWAQIETHNRGRDVLLSGTPPNESVIAQAKEAAIQAAGVRIVDVTTDVAPLAPPASPADVKASIVGDVITLSGTVADQGTIDTLLAQAQSTYGVDNVVNQLSIGDNVASMPAMDAILATIKGRAPELSLALQDNQLTLSGEMPDDPSKLSLLTSVRGFFSGQVIDQLSVTPPPAIEAAPVVEKDVCETLIADLLSESKINFQTGKASISENSFDLLKEIAGIANRCEGASFEVAGHTDSTGSAAGNQRLSQARAQAVVNYLVELGMSSDRFTPVGYGPSQPIGDNTTNAGRAQNRRIEFRLKN